MNPTDSDDVPRTDGGTPEIPLTEVSDEEVTTADRAIEWLAKRKEVFLVAWEDWRTKFGIIVMGLFVLMGTVGVWLVPEPTMAVGQKWTPPLETLEYPLGTNQYGQGILASLVHATPAMWKMVLAGAVFATVIGTAIGTFAGYKGGLIDEVLTTITDIAMMLPGLPLVIVITAVWAPENPYLVGILVSINAWAGGARNLRSQVLTIREESYVEASRIMNVSTWNILQRDIIPQLLPLILINFVMAARGVIFNAVGLYFLGVLPFTTQNWGVMLNLAYESGAVTTPELLYTVIFPLVTIVLFSWGLIMVAQGLDRVVNVRIRADSTEGQ
ncbi:ABC transporter permease [Halomontanus rarus]|uniref:ABC transporter permease n=1 Tax=Halomontanus rarus TaxID=3034020 RepID=UPI00293BA209|nr:ABC transporter permease [Halovivax sp. KZCA124]